MTFGRADGFPDACVLKPEWIRSVERTELGPYIATLPDRRWEEVRSALFLALGFDEPHLGGAATK